MFTQVIWQITANHGGGYQYRLCPAGQVSLTPDPGPYLKPGPNPDSSALDRGVFPEASTPV